MLGIALLHFAFAAEPAVPDPLVSYRQEKLSVVRYVAAGSGVRLRSEYYQGGRMLFGPQVYAVLGRHDLVETWERRVAVNVGFGVGGAALALGGLAMTSPGGSDRTSTAVGFALTFVGVSCVAVPFFNRADAGDWDEVDGLIDRHNIGLAERYGVPLTVAAP